MFKFRDISIPTQLRAGMGLLVAFSLLLGFIAWHIGDLLWMQTKLLYDHPLTVRRAIGDLAADALLIDREMERLSLTRDEAEFTLSLEEIDRREADVNTHLEVLRDRYLGPSADLEAIQAELQRWRSTRDQAVRLLRSNQLQAARELIRENNLGRSGAANLLDLASRITDFARHKADQFFAEATAQSSRLDRLLAIILGVVVVLSVLISYFLIKHIREPLHALMYASEQFRAGQREVRSNYRFGNEFGRLSLSFNALADTIEAESAVSRQSAHLAESLLSTTDARSFFHELLKGLMEVTGSQLAAVYLLNRQKTGFDRFESIGLPADAPASFSREALEGEFGLPLATRQIQHIADVPADTPWSFPTVSGSFKPRALLTIPLLSEGEVAAVVSLASLQPYHPTALRLVTDMVAMTTARMEGVLTFEQVRDLATRLDEQNRELEVQRTELAAQANELTEQNIELELQQRELRTANRLRSSFLSKMTHELRTPLNSIIALSGVLTRRLNSQISQEESGYLEVIERNGRNLLLLINDILDLSRLAAGRTELRISRFSIADLVREVAALLEPQALGKNISLVTSLPESLPSLASDPILCRQILQNLVGNAVKFTDAGGVTISVTARDEHLVLSVQDTGIGISSEHIPYIFDEFRQADDSLARRHGGTGLGLAIVKKYTVLLQGDIEVESRVGEGSTFTLTLPLEITASEASTGPGEWEAGASPMSAPSGARSPLAGTKRSVLLVEDTEPMVIQMTDILGQEGYEIRVARDGKEALREVWRLLPDAVILDLMMPEMDGFEVLRTLRGSEATRELPVLVMTAKHVSAEEIGLLAGNHVHQWIQKGDVSRKDLLTAVAGLFQPRRERPKAGDGGDNSPPPMMQLMR